MCYIRWLCHSCESRRAVFGFQSVFENSSVYSILMILNYAARSVKAHPVYHASQLTLSRPDQPSEDVPMRVVVHGHPHALVVHGIFT